MKKPKKQKNVTKNLKKKHKYELKRKEIRKQQKVAFIETMRDLKNLPEEERNKILGEDEDLDDAEY
jgi:spore coat protein CotF